MKRLRRQATLALRLSVMMPILAAFGPARAQAPNVGLYRVFERSVENTKAYPNKFTGVELRCSYTSPSGKKIEFNGFFDGDGKGGGSTTQGTVWKMRFMPEELGTWKYQWSWSDGTPGGEGIFSSVSQGAGKGPLRPYAKNPRWLAYNGTEPVHLKSYYESSMRPFAQPFDCAEKYYQTLLDNGYNHLQVNWLLPIHPAIKLADCGGPSNSKPIYSEGGHASTSMNLDVWHLLEGLMDYLNEKNVGLFMFLGFDGGRNGLPQAWVKLSEGEKDFFVRYVVARLAPYAIIAGWNYVWEVPGDREEEELGCMRLVKKYDVFDHLRGYQDEKPNFHEFHRPEYNFAGVENHNMHADLREPEYWDEPWTHHKACLVGYVPGKPVYMVEGNLLWRHYWAPRLTGKEGQNHTPDLTRQAAWACATGAASFTWCGHTSLKLGGSDGLPFFGATNPYSAAAKAMDILEQVLTEEVVFYRMTPQDSLLSGHDSEKVWCLGEPGSQYLVFSTAGAPFSLRLESGEYSRSAWLDSKTGTTQALPAIRAEGGKAVPFAPPGNQTDWVLLVRKQEVSAILSRRTGGTIPRRTPFLRDGSLATPWTSYRLDGKVRAINLTESPAGIYILQEKGGSGRSFWRILKQ